MITRLPLKKLDSKFLPLILVIAIFLAIYGSMAPTEPTGLHLSDTLISQAHFLGLVDAPGYPIYTLLLFLVTNTLGRLVGVAFAAHLLSSIMASVALGFLYQITQIFYATYHVKNRFLIFSHTLTANLLSLAVITTVGFSNYFWRYGIFAHQYALTQLLLVIALFIFFRLQLTKPRNKSKWLIGLSIALGLGISHQWIFVPLTLVLVYLLRRDLLNLPTQIKSFSAIGLLTATVLPFLLLITYQNNQVEFSYRLSPNIGGVIEYVTQAYLGDGLAIASDLRSIIQQVSVEVILNNIWQISILLLKSLGVLGLVFLAPFILFTTPPKKFNSTLSLVLILGSMLLSLGLVFVWVEDLFNFPELTPQLLVLHPVLALLMWFGLYELISRGSGAISALANPKFSRVLFVVLILISSIVPYLLRVNSVSLDDKLVTAKVSRETLADLDPDSIMACFSYSACYGLIYQQRVNKLRPDIIIVPFYYLPERMNFAHNDLQGFDYGTYPMVMYDIITWNRDSRTIYSIDMFEDYFGLFGIDYGFLFYIPLGYYNLLTSEIPEELPETDLTLSSDLVGFEVPGWDKVLEKAKLELVKRHIFNTTIYLKSGLRVRGVSEANLATSLAYDLSPQASKEISDLRTGVESLLPSEFYKPGSKAETVDTILSNVEELIKGGRIIRATQIAQGAVTLDPRNVDARLKWAQLLEMTESSQAAVIEYRNVEQLDPGNTVAESRLEYQRQLGIE